MVYLPKFFIFHWIEGRQHLYALLLSVRTHIKPFRVTEYYHVSLVILLKSFSKSNVKKNKNPSKTPGFLHCILNAYCSSWPTKKEAFKKSFLVIASCQRRWKVRSVRSVFPESHKLSFLHSLHPSLPHTMQICTRLASRATDWMKIVVWHFPICLSLSFKRNFKAICLFFNFQHSIFFFFFKWRKLFCS